MLTEEEIKEIQEEIKAISISRQWQCIDALEDRSASPWMGI
jgi:hypothetical protein